MKKFYKKTITGKRKEVGAISGSKFIKHIEFSQHLFKKANALGVDSDLISKMEESGVRVILLIDDETGDKYVCSYERFLKHSWIHSFSGFQPQRFLALDRWHIYTKMNVKIQEAKKTEDDLELDKKKDEAVQGELIPVDVKMKLVDCFKNSQKKKSSVP